MLENIELSLFERLRNLPGYEGLERLWEIIPTARLVGGCVRDLLCGADIHDFDLASPLRPEEAQECLEKKGIKVIPTGLEHGTITIVIKHRAYELTTLRRDVETDGRHALVAWTDSWQEDAARRDFTINAMSLDCHGTIYDFFNGQQDLLVGRVRFVGKASQRIIEDSLRILRFFRFQARYGYEEADLEACEAIIQHSHLLKKLSIERVASEILKILSGPKVSTIINLMEKTGVVSIILPSARSKNLERLLLCEDPPHALRRLYAFCPDPEVGAYFKLSNVDRAALKAFASPFPELHCDMNDDALRRVLALQSLSVVIDRTWLMQAHVCGGPDSQWSEFRYRLESMPQPEFLLSGRDGINIGLKEGPDLGRWIKKTREWWMKEGCRPDREACKKWLKEQLSPL